MGLKIQSFPIGKIIVVLGILFMAYAVFNLNVQEFKRLKQQHDADFAIGIENNKFDFLQIEHIGVMFENAAQHKALFVFPDDKCKYDTAKIFADYKLQQKFQPDTVLNPDTIYVTKTDTSCINKKNCNEDFKEILSFAEKYNMQPKVYDLTAMCRQ